jgi:hypothetical protein
MFFLLKSKQDILQCCAYISSLSLLGKRWTIKIEEYKPKRSLAQNRLWHSWISEWAKIRGDNPEHLKVLIKHHLGMYEYITNPKTGEVIPAMKSTAGLSVEDFSDLILQTEILAAQQGHIFKKDADYYEAQGIKDAPSGDGHGRRGHIVSTNMENSPAALQNEVRS